MRSLPIAVVLCLCGAYCVAAEHPVGHRKTNHDFLLFPDASGVHTLDGTDADEDLFVDLNILYSYTSPKFRALVEYAISNEENEVERLQLGWRFSDQLLLWGGRVHNPDNYWNTTFHHGQYLQTSISRPWISRFEDEGGPLLAHTTGMLIETEHHRDNGGALNAYLSVGIGAHLESDLEPFDLFSPASDHGFAAHGRLAYLPDFLGQNQVGVVASYNEFDTVRSSGTPPLPISSIDQYSVGAYADWQWGRTRLISEVRYVSNKLNLPVSIREHFTSFYAFLEQKLSDSWTAYGRADLIDEDSSIYLSLLEEDISEQWVAGIRWDFARRHALTLEIQDQHSEAPDLDRVNLQLQWSAVLP